jgi:hypothetical protein
MDFAHEVDKSVRTYARLRGGLIASLRECHALSKCYVGAALSFTSMIPIVGDAIGKGGKAARFIANKADDVMALGRQIKCKVTGTGCFVAGTKVWLSATVDQTADQPHRVSDLLSPQLDHSSTATLTAPTRTITKRPIESVSIGSRVSGDNPRPWDFDGELAVPDQATWLLGKFSLQKENGNWVDIEMIRPAAYWESQEASPGSFVFMEFPELEASGMAQVKSIEPCPPIADGSTNVVTARIVTRHVSELVELTIEGGEAITGTPQHPIWSIERQDWVELGDLEVGEHLWTEDGPVEILATRLISTGESVYNLEVYGDHIYQIGNAGVLVHNGCKNRANHVYKIYDAKTGKVIKYGIGSKITKSGLSERAQGQLTKLRAIYGNNIKVKIVAKNLTRVKARSMERGLVNSYSVAAARRGGPRFQRPPKNDYPHPTM